MTAARERIAPENVMLKRAHAAAELALGEDVKLAVWTSIMQTFISPSGRVVHIWTFASELRVEVPRMSIDPATAKLVAR